MGQNFTQGRDAVVKVAPLAIGSRTRPADSAFVNLRGTSVSVAVSSNDITRTIEFGGDAGTNDDWDDGITSGKSWTSNFSGLWKDTDSARIIVEDAGLKKDATSNTEVYFLFFPSGEIAGTRYFHGVAAINEYTVDGPADGESSFSWTGQGRGKLTVEDVAATP